MGAPETMARYAAPLLAQRDLAASAYAFGKDRENLAGPQHLDRAPDGLRIDLPTVEGDLADVSEELTHRLR